MTEVDPFAGREVGVTIKYGEGFQAPWLTLRGTVEANRESLIAAYALDPEKCEGLTLHDLIIECATIAQAAAAAVEGLGAKPVGQRGGRGNWGSRSGGSSAKSEDSTPEEPKDERHQLIPLIEKCESIPDLQRLWAENKSEFDEHAEVMEAYKIKGRALSGAVG